MHTKPNSPKHQRHSNPRTQPFMNPLPNCQPIPQNRKQEGQRINNRDHHPPNQQEKLSRINRHP
ncbi:hypothetical protein B9Z19DRAFT_1096094 [Tuber borchii]|uniref:Uncharacterized protein n=1 Tax=Tuber borchii TaxID=42251 RepID=A0A2T6ZBW0_TUBBO|nr:hypothetical protein B9Z19DRAFT_1096094 [Tuber borchii]